MSDPSAGHDDGVDRRRAVLHHAPDVPGAGECKEYRVSQNEVI